MGEWLTVFDQQGKKLERNYVMIFIVMEICMKRFIAGY